MRSLLLLIVLAAPLAAQRPNILFLFTDDQAPWALGFEGHPDASTPHLDKLFARGAYLENSFTVTPVCSPSRASLMTSRYGSELGITDWINPSREPNKGLSPSTTTWPEVLQSAGYHTGLVGKWHLGLNDHFHPTKTGFSYFMGFRGGGTSPDNPVLEKDGKELRFEGLTTDILTDHALGFLEANREKTFALAVHYRAPHARWLPVADEDWAPFDGLTPTLPHPDYPDLDVEQVDRRTREYLASVRGVDRNVGRILARLDELGLRDDTIIIYSSDHGYSMGHNGIWHKGNGHWILTEPPAATANVPSGQRPNMWDNSIKVPTAVVWPGVVKPGTRINETVSNLDWYPTLVEWAGASLPDGETIRGRNLVPLLKGASDGWDNDLYAEYSTHHQSRTDMRMWRTPDWKLVRDFLNPERDELYDLRADPQELRNLIGAEDYRLAQVVERLDVKIRTHMRETGDPLLKALE